MISTSYGYGYQPFLQVPCHCVYMLIFLSLRPWDLYGPGSLSSPEISNVVAIGQRGILRYPLGCRMADKLVDANPPTHC